MKIIYNFVWYKLKIEILFYQPFGYVAWNCILYSTIAFNDHIMKKKCMKIQENTVFVMKLCIKMICKLRNNVCNKKKIFLISTITIQYIFDINPDFLTRLIFYYKNKLFMTV